MVSGRQIRAARGLLKWSSSTLAEKAGLTRETINKIEDESVQPREGTLNDIIRVFDVNGVEFTDHSGVRMKPHGIEILTGQDGFHRFYEIIYADLMSKGGFIQACGVDENLFCHHYGETISLHFERMVEMCKSRGVDHCMQILVCEGNTQFVAEGYAKYRWLSAEYSSTSCFYVFNNYLALISFTAIPTPYIFLIDSEAFADAYRQQFQKLWVTAKEPSEAAEGTEDLLQHA